MRHLPRQAAGNAEKVATAHNSEAMSRFPANPCGRRMGVALGRRHAAQGIILQDEVVVQRHKPVETGDDEKHGSAIAVELRNDAGTLLDRRR